MPGWNGAGTFERYHDWTTDRDASINPSATRFDQEDDNTAEGINNCLTKDGQNSPTTNLPMGGNRHTGVANAAARNDYAAAGQVQDGAFQYAADTGAANAYVIAPTPAITAYAVGQVFRFIAANANTGASTLAVSGLAAKTIKINGNTLDPESGDIPANGVVTAVYDGTLFQIQVGAPGLTGSLAAKADKVSSPTTGNLAGLDANGNLTDSGKAPSDFADDATTTTALAAKAPIDNPNFTTNARLAGANLATQTWVTSQGYLSSIAADSIGHTEIGFGTVVTGNSGSISGLARWTVPVGLYYAIWVGSGIGWKVEAYLNGAWRLEGTSSNRIISLVSDGSNIRLVPDSSAVFYYMRLGS